ncbi:WYL domain-containing protein [Microbulbifer sp. JMSA003]|uniref:WYL domain-containing protein n=1 Tax=Microbulbifer sp. JMSA003 TaxID=3243369 RepID=UPI00403A078D
MSTPPTQAQKRLALIDLYLAFFGRCSRADLWAHFDAAPATATRAFKDYRNAFPGKLAYSVSDRCYMASSEFVPAFEHDVMKGLTLFAYGLDSNKISGKFFGTDSPELLTAPLAISVVAPITRAIVSGTGVDVEYSSGSSGATVRTLFPTSVFQGGGAWYFRALDILHSEYRSFRFSRVGSASPTVCKRRKEQLFSDPDWDIPITVTVAPHPNRANHAALKEDLGLSDKPVKNISVKPAICGFVLTDLRVDCSPSGDMNPFEYPLRLMNRHELLGISSMVIAPGFKPAPRVAVSHPDTET